MGVYHISGLGRNLGAFTVPLTCVYLLLKASESGVKEATEFFATSGEMQQKSKGAPEAFIIFTSKEVINGGIEEYQSEPLELEGKRDLTDIQRFFKTLFKETGMKQKYYENSWLRYFYVISVKHDDFEDCLSVMLPTFYALRQKETWVSLVGGTNQVTSSLLLSALFTTSGSRFYYVFQEHIKKLFPEWLELRHSKKDLKEGTQRVLERWLELPVPYLWYSEVIQELMNEFREQKALNISQVKEILLKHELPMQVLPKLKERWIIIEDEKVRKGPYLEKIEKLFNVQNAPKNYSEWKEFMKKEKRLYEIDPETGKLNFC